jgi:CRISPR-associated protein Cas1
MKNKGPRLLLTDRNAVHLIERARVYVDGGRVVFRIAEDGRDKVFNLPFANVAVLFLGQGTSLTTEAARLLADEGVYVAFTGTGGTPLHYGSLTVYQPTEYMQRMYRVSSNPAASLAAAKVVMRHRIQMILKFLAPIAKRHDLDIDDMAIQALAPAFLQKIQDTNTIPELLSREAEMAKSLYKVCARSAAVDAFKREHGKGARNTFEDVINSRIDHGNYLAYGISGAALWVLGIPASLSVFHGKTRAGGLVFDLADSFKDSIVLPVAFGSHASESDFRKALISEIHNADLIRRSIDVARAMIEAGESALAGTLSE